MRLGRLIIAAGLAALATATPAPAHEDDDVSASADLPAFWAERNAGRLTPELAFLPTTEPARALAPPAPSLPMPGTVELVGHDPLMSRGMNAALAVHGDHAYVGSRTDGSHLNAGILVVDVQDPAQPSVVHEFATPAPGETTRELRVLPEQELLMVLIHGCSELIHRCANTTQLGATLADSQVRFYDISGANAAAPQLVSTYLPSNNRAQTPHEFFIWTDPARPSRVLMYSTTPTDANDGPENLVVTDLSRAREGEFPEIVKWTTTIDNPDRDNRLHSLTVSNDGTRAYLAFLGGGFLVADTSDLAEDVAEPQVRLVTPAENRVFWTDPGAHSAIKLPGRQVALTTDEVYGQLGGLLAAHGCPWGWMRFIDIADETRPKIVSEYRLPSNDPDICAGVTPDRDNLSSFASHNPTLTEHLALVTWHSAGFQVVSTADPAQPKGAAEFVPEPLPVVQTEDPALSSGPDKVVMWSFPVVKDGLIYVVDLRNGLYVLRYRGPYEEEVSRVAFLDGNSNSGDALRMEPVKGDTTANPSAPPGPGTGAPAAGRACLASPLRATPVRLGPFRLGMRPKKARLRGGPALRRRVACVEGGGKVALLFRRKRIVAIAARAAVTGRGTRRIAGTRVVNKRGIKRRALRRLARRTR